MEQRKDKLEVACGVINVFDNNTDASRLDPLLDVPFIEVQVGHG